jgi:hypothetical protein
MIRLLLFILISPVIFASQCDLANPVDNCFITPAGVKLRYLMIGLCKGSPRIPTIDEPFDYANCQIIYDQLEETGTVVEWTKADQHVDISTDIVIPADGVYDHLFFIVDTDAWVKFDVEFSQPQKTFTDTGGVTQGRFCRSVDDQIVTWGPGIRTGAYECSSERKSAAYTYWKLWDEDGIDDSYCDSWAGRFINSSLYLETQSVVNQIGYLGVVSIPPVTVNDSKTELAIDWKFDEFYRLDVDRRSESSGWFLPYPVCSSISVDVR